MTDHPFVPDRGLPPASAISLERFQEIMDADAPFATLFALRVEDIGPGTARFRMDYRPAVDAPNGGVTGAALMALADVAIYGVVLSVVGPVPLAVTTHLNVDLVRRCPRGDVIASASLIRAGRRLVTAEAWLASAADRKVVAHATGTYSVPPPERR
ncbi:PaaI family thioesterase [Novispirillum sp. DQ9]|uniref:PaaI family thioesterase n=1 Tax=Novispirillum sp. DQ9 TaxID=3398612 RepID=UPI003C7C35C9